MTTYAPDFETEGSRENNKSNSYMYLGHVSAVQQLGVEAVSRRTTRIPDIRLRDELLVHIITTRNYDVIHVNSDHPGRTPHP